MGGRADSEISGIRRSRLPTSSLLLSFAIGASIACSDARGAEVDYEYGFEISSTEFDEELFAGSTVGFSGYIAVIFEEHYRVGLRIHDSIFFTPSLDRGKELSGDDNLLDIGAWVLYMQRDWPVSRRLRFHAMAGISRVEIEDEEFVCPIFFPCLPFSETVITYRNSESGLAYGFGGNWAITDSADLSLTFIDYSDSEFDYRSLHFGYNVHHNR